MVRKFAILSTILLSSPAFAESDPPPCPPDGQTFSKGVILAHLCPGADAGEKIYSAMRVAESLPAVDAGLVIDARGLVGNQTISRPLNIGGLWTRPVSLLLGQVKLEVRATIHLGRGSSIVGLPLGLWAWQTPGAPLGSYIYAAKDAGLYSVIQIGDGIETGNLAGQGTAAVLRDLVVDGNGVLLHDPAHRNNLGTNPDGSVVLVHSASRIDFTNLSVVQGLGTGIRIQSADPLKGAAMPTLLKVNATGNGRNGLEIYKTNDAFIAQSQFEDNGASGVALDGARATRISGSDFGGNQLAGRYLMNGADYLSLSGNQFGNSHGHDLIIDGGGDNQIANNQFIGSPNRGTNTDSAIRLSNSSGNIINGNLVILENLLAGINIYGPGSNVVTSNVLKGAVAVGAALKI
jgi:hypothetical protein